MSLLHTLHSYILNCWQSVHYLYASTFPPTIILHPLPQWMYFPDAWTSQAYLGKLILTFLPLSGITLFNSIISIKFSFVCGDSLSVHSLIWHFHLIPWTYFSLYIFFFNSLTIFTVAALTYVTAKYLKSEPTQSSYVWTSFVRHTFLFLG